MWLLALIVFVAAGLSYAIFWPDPVEGTGDARGDRMLEFEHNVAQAQALTIMGAVTIGAVLVALVAISLIRGRRPAPESREQ